MHWTDRLCSEFHFSVGFVSVGDLSHSFLVSSFLSCCLLHMLVLVYWFYWNLFIVNLYQVDETNSFPNDIFAAELLLRSADSLSVQWLSSCVQQIKTCSQQRVFKDQSNTWDLFLHLMTRHSLSTWELIYAEHKTAGLQNKKENLTILKWRNNEDSEAKLRVWCCLWTWAQGSTPLSQTSLPLNWTKLSLTPAPGSKISTSIGQINPQHHFPGKEGPATAARPACPEEE